MAPGQIELPCSYLEGLCLLTTHILSRYTGLHVLKLSLRLNTLFRTIEHWVLRALPWMQQNWPDRKTDNMDLPCEIP